LREGGSRETDQQKQAFHALLWIFS
jgi:hypothetical protein